MTKSDAYIITYKATVEAKVVFESELTEQEAIEAFEDGNFYDIIDSDEVSDAEVLKVKAY